VDPDRARQTLDALAASKRPIVIAGSGAYYSGAGEELLAFMEKSGVPVFTASQGRGLVPDTHPLCFQASLIIRPGAASYALNNTDLVVLLGNRISMFYGCGQLFCSGAKFVQVDIDPAELGRNRTIDIPVVSDVKSFLAECLRAMDAGSPVSAAAFAPWIAELRGVQEQGRNFGRASAESSAVPIHPFRLASEIDRYMDREDDIVVGDGGDTQVWMSMARTAVKEGHYLESGIYGCLGLGIPYAIAAKILYPDKRVLNIIGDGSVGFNFMEFETAIRKKIPVVIVINNDLGWGMIRHSQRLKLGSPLDEGTELGRVEYHRIVESMGGLGILVEKPDEIIPALDRAFASGKTACVNVMTDPAAIGPGAMALAMVSGYKIPGLGD
jgi:acetolactate synthase-1/2/3 large subunit